MPDIGWRSWRKECRKTSFLIRIDWEYVLKQIHCLPHSLADQTFQSKSRQRPWSSRRPRFCLTSWVIVKKCSQLQTRANNWKIDDGLKVFKEETNSLTCDCSTKFTSTSYYGMDSLHFRRIFQFFDMRTKHGIWLQFLVKRNKLWESLPDKDFLMHQTWSSLLRRCNYFDDFKETIINDPIWDVVISFRTHNPCLRNTNVVEQLILVQSWDVNSFLKTSIIIKRLSSKQSRRRFVLISMELLSSRLPWNEKSKNKK